MITSLIKLILTAISTYLGVILVYPKLITFLHKVKFGQTVRLDGPKSHHKKQGTPTMGGIGFVLIPLIVILMVNIEFLFASQFWLLYGTYIAYGVIGFLDDYIIVVQKNNVGLKPIYKLLLQAFFAIMFYSVYALHASTEVNFIFFKLDLGFLYFPFLLLIFAAESNAVNLTDGVDGLCASVYSIAIIPFGIIAYYKHEYVVLSVIISVLFALIGYLKFNKYPAKIFMGDTGSLALGGMFAALAVVLKIEILLLVIGGVFLVETISVIIQVLYYKKTKKRVFLMTPLHHHYEQKGLNEKAIVRLFSSVEIVLSVIGVILWLLFW